MKHEVYDRLAAAAKANPTAKKALATIDDGKKALFQSAKRHATPMERQLIEETPCRSGG
jgi:hypothetical protein